MEGVDGSRGVNFRALQSLFRISMEDNADFKTTISISMLEVYNEKIKDLLGVAASRNAAIAKADFDFTDLEIRMGKQGVFVEHLRELPVEDMLEVQTLILKGCQNRQTASNNVNEHSSRSHLVIIIKVDRENRRSGEKLAGLMTLVDLAGSERVKLTSATGQRLREAQHINKSLSSLGDVIAALASGQKHIPYRNSKLTFLLQDCLKESSKVLMFVNINPIPDYAQESTCSLQFATRCRSVQLGQARKVTVV